MNFCNCKNHDCNCHVVKKIYVDVDGTLLSGSLDLEFKKRSAVEAFSSVLAWYENCGVDDLALNMELIVKLVDLKEQGYELILWTNRGVANIEMTRRNLGIYWHMFSSHEFHDGKKGKCVLDGFVIDNEEKYLACGLSGVLVNFNA